MSSHSSVLLLLVILWSSVHEGRGLPMRGTRDVGATHRVRSKRCSCSNFLDSECHYFCHLDIVWVNTPSKTTVYGLGNALSRRRRSAGRCTCANPDDLTCTNFCHNSLDITFSKRPEKRQQLNILSILRAVARRSRRDQFPEAQRENAP